MRIACLRIPDFAIWTRRRHDPDLLREAVVIGPLPPARGDVVAVSTEARRLGVAAGMAVSAARAVAPTARFFAPDPDLDGRACRALVEALDRLTPGVETKPESPGVFHLDLRGLSRHHASEEAFAARVRSAATGLGYPAASVGIASTRFAAAVAAAEARGRIRIVLTGNERDFLAPLPLDHLPVDPDVLEELLLLGLRSMGDFAALPAETIAARFGRHGGELHALARGEDPTPLTPTREESLPEATLALDEPEEDLDRLCFHLRRAAEALIRTLATLGLATSGVRLVLALEDRSEVRRETRFVRPVLGSRLLVDCLRIELGRKPPGGRVTGLRIEAFENAPARPEQLLLFARRLRASDPGAVEEALDRVRALVGPEGLVSPQVASSWRPECRVGWRPYATLPAATTPSFPATLSGDPRHDGAGAETPARLLAPPLPARVTRARGRLTFLETDLATGRVATSEGPHRLEGDWWGEGWAREYWSATLADGGRYWLYHDRSSDDWRLQGVFD